MLPSLPWLFNPVSAASSAVVGWFAGSLFGDDDDGGWRLGWGAKAVVVLAIVAWATVSLARAGVLKKGSALYKLVETVAKIWEKAADLVLGLVRPLVNLLPGVAL